MVITIGELNKTIKQRTTFSSGSFQVLNTGNSIKTGYIYIYIYIYNKDDQIEEEKIFFFKLNNPCIQEFPKYIKNMIV